MAKILMIQIQPAPYAGTAYLNGAVLSSGHEFVLHLESDTGEILRKVSKEKPDCIGFSCMTGIHNDALRISKAIKENFDIPIIMGGPHPTLFPEVINEPHLDIICRGEGEFALIELLDALDNNKSYHHILNLWLKNEGYIVKNKLRPLVEPLDNIPLIDWSCYEGTIVKKSPPIAFLIRGCPYSCTYCFNVAMRRLYKGLGKYIRYFSVDRSIREIRQAIDFFSQSPVLFTSDTFGTDIKWTEELFFNYSQLTDLPFVLLIRPELATPKLINIIKKYNCFSVALGVESGSERVRKELLNRNYSNPLLLRAANTLHDAGIRFRTYNILGIPSETEEELWETIDINIQMKTDFPRSSIFTPYPGTELAKIAQNLGYLDESFNFDSTPSSILSHSILKKIDHNIVQNSFYFFQTVILFPKLRPIIKKLIKLKPNFVFRLWFYFIYAYLHRKSEGRKLTHYIQYAWANFKITK
jgi:radical SAM superfamily enzyme YgiQ (UPF0313 family)